MIEYTIGPMAKLITVRMAGVTDFDELSRHIQRLWDDPEFDPTFDTLCKMDNEAQFRVSGVSSRGARLLEA